MTNLSKLLHPFIPKGCEKIRTMLNLENNFSWNEEMISGDIQINDLQIMYDRIDEKKII